MSILSDLEIRKLASENKMIFPFGEREGGISSGISSYGYDAKLANKIFIFNDGNGKLDDGKQLIIDPMNFNTDLYTEHINDDYFILPPHAFALGKTFEYFKIPSDVLVICLGKSTYARCGIVINVTPLEPGWEGYVTLEFSNTTNYPARLYANRGICQFIFFKADTQCETTYDKRGGKYMFQQDIQIPKL